MKNDHLTKREKISDLFMVPLASGFAIFLMLFIVFAVFFTIFKYIF